MLIFFISVNTRFCERESLLSLTVQRIEVRLYIEIKATSTKKIYNNLTAFFYVNLIILACHGFCHKLHSDIILISSDIILISSDIILISFWYQKWTFFWCQLISSDISWIWKIKLELENSFFKLNFNSLAMQIVNIILFF